MPALIFWCFGFRGKIIRSEGRKRFMQIIKSTLVGKMYGRSSGGFESVFPWPRVKSIHMLCGENNETH